MLIARLIVALAKPALAGGVVAATAGGGWLAVDQLRGDDVTAFRAATSQGQRLLINEFGEDTDTIYSVDPAAPDARAEIATIDHAPGWGAFATLSPDGEAIAYTALPPDAEQPSPDSPARAAIIGADGDVSLLADDIDLLVPPVWSPDSASIVVRKNSPAADSAGRFELILLDRDGGRGTITSWSSAAVFPIAFSPDGSLLYFATLSASGTDVYSVAPDGADETLIAHLSDEIARDWKLSPDGSTLAYSVAESGPTPGIVTMTLALASGEASPALAAASAGDEYNPAWSPDGALTIATLDAEGGDAVTIDGDGFVARISKSAGGIDLPVSWSPDGDTLAVRAVEGDGESGAGESRLELIDGDGGRRRISDKADVLIVGWLE